jgi:phosphopantetheinyl transferase (holo-ACP synthase)
VTALHTAWPDGEELEARPGPATCTRSQVPFDASTDVRALAHEYLGPDEQAAFEAKTGRGRVEWLLGRVAAKDAVQRHLLSRDFALIDPTRIVVDNDAHGCPRVRVWGAALATRGLRVSIAHKPAVAVAVAAIFRLPPASPDADGPWVGIGIDVEAVEPRSPSFERTALTPTERSLQTDTEDERDTWLTRLWTVKEAAAKATGLGLGGRPKDFEIDAVLGGRLRCRGRWIATEPLEIARGRFMVAWTDSC